MRWFAMIAAVTAVWFAAGCGDSGPVGLGAPKKRPPLYPVKGVVKHNGMPLGYATIAIVPNPGAKDAFGAVALTNADGTFEAKSFAPTVGMPEGRYMVTVRKTTSGSSVAAPSKPAPALPANLPAHEIAAMKETAAVPATSSAVPEKYGDLATTDLFIEVPQGGKIDIVLELKD